MLNGMISPEEAAARAEVSYGTIIYWCRYKYKGLGKKTAGRWQINSDRLDLIIKGEYQELEDGKKKKTGSTKTEKKKTNHRI